MRAFLITSFAGLLAGWWACAGFLRSAGYSAGTDTAPALREAGKKHQNLDSHLANTPAVEIPALADKAVTECLAGTAQWETHLLPVWRRWAQFAPEAALAHIRSTCPRLLELDRNAGIWIQDQILSVWASHAPGDAAAWLRDRLPPVRLGGTPAVQKNAGTAAADYPALMATLSLRDFKSAFSLVPFFFDQRALQENGSDIIKPWMPVFYKAALQPANLAAFIREVQGVTRDDIRGQLCADTLLYLREMPAAAREEIIAQLPIPERWPPGVLNPWASLAFKDVSDASEPETVANSYAARLQPGNPGNSLVLEFIINAWAPREPEEAGRWLSNWNGDPAAAAARGAYARTAFKNEPVEAFAWVREFSRPQELAEAAKNIYLQWHSDSPEDADAWLMSGDFPPALVSALLGKSKMR